MITEFTPFASSIGGALIGLAAVLLMLSLGRIMGATGILIGAIVPEPGGDRAWRIALLAGMVSGPGLFYTVTGAWPTINIPISNLMIVVGGLIVGVGVTLGSGCTSGHGVCGLARLSNRSAVAVVVFMIGTAATVYISRHIIGVSV